MVKPINMRECSLPDCRVQNNFLTTFNVPTKDPDVRKQWIKFLKTHGKVVHENSAISLCELHFDPSDIVYGKFRKTLKHNSVPIALCVSFLVIGLFTMIFSPETFSPNKR